MSFSLKITSMRNSSKALLAALLLLLAACQPKAVTEAPVVAAEVTAAVGDVPALELLQLDGSTVASSSLVANNQPTLVNLWATWCAPCVAELPLLSEFQQQHPDWQLLYINQAENPAKIQQFLQKRQLDVAPIYIDNSGKWAHAVAANGFPITIVYSAAGQQLKLHRGALTADDLTELASLAQ